MLSLSVVLVIYDRANQAHRSFQSDKNLAELNKALNWEPICLMKQTMCYN